MESRQFAVWLGPWWLLKSSTVPHLSAQLGVHLSASLCLC